MELLKNKQADHAVEFIEALHLCGDYHGEECRLRPWQQQIIRRLFGTVDENGLRTIRRMLLFLPRKASKTWLSAAIAVYALVCLGERQQIISAAASQDQAGRIFEAMVEIIQQDETLRSMLDIIPSKKRIVCEATGSFYVAATAGGDALHGLSPSVVIVDELHAMEKPTHRKLFAALTTGRGARKEPLTILISTQSSNRNSLCAEEFNYATKLKGRIVNGETQADGTIDNPAYLAILYYATRDDDIADEKLWHKVNPALGDFLDIKEYRDNFEIVKEIPSRETWFRQYYLNTPIDEFGKWVNMDLWNECKQTEDIDLDGRECYAALDLAPARDLSCLTLLFPIDEKIVVRTYAWCNQSDIIERTKLEKVPYDVWQRAGWIKATPGNSTDFAAIREDIKQLNNRYPFKKLAADQQHAYQIGQELWHEGIPTEWFRQGYISMGPPTARLEKLMLDRTILHDDNPVANYCLSCLRCEGPDPAGNFKPSNKLKEGHERIDAAVSLIMAIGVWLPDSFEQPGAFISWS